MKSLVAGTKFAGLAIAIAGLMLQGCIHAPPTPLAGSSSFSFIEHPTPNYEAKIETPEQPREPIDVVAPAEPIAPLAKPIYPAVALARPPIPAVVGLQITVDASGRVTQTAASLRAFSTPGPMADAFRTAVEEALAQWRFTPAEKRHLVPRSGPGGEGYWVITKTEKTDYTFDVAFTFTSAGDVTSGLVK